MHLKGSPDVKYAVKIYIKNANQDAQIRHFRQEGVLKKMLHSNIIKLHDMSETGKLSSMENDTSDVRYAVLELASNGNFLDYIANNAMDQQIARYYFKQL
jgi:serine/threonine protein kinase